MSDTHDNTAQHAHAFFEEVRAYLRPQMPENCTESCAEPAAWGCNGWVARGQDAITLKREKYHRLSLAPTGNLLLQVDTLAIPGTIKPRRAYKLTRDNWQTEIAKALRLIRERAALAAAYAAQREAEMQQGQQERQQIETALASLPDDVFARRSRYGDWEAPSAKARLQDDALAFRVQDALFVDGPTAARLFEILGGQLDIKIDRTVTPEQFVELCRLLTHTND